jgi:hypothetical protein
MSLIKSIFELGKIIFIPTNESVPPLPEMSLLFLKEEERCDIYPWRAVCIDLEMDACGNSMFRAWENLKKSLLMYIEMEEKEAGGSIIKAAKIITKAAFSESEQKREYFALYRQAKSEYFIRSIEANLKSVTTEKKQRAKNKTEKQQYLKLEIEQEPLPSKFDKFNEGVKVSATYLFWNQQGIISPTHSSTMILNNPTSVEKQWITLLSPPQGRIVSYPKIKNELASLKRKHNSAVQI